MNRLFSKLVSARSLYSRSWRRPILHTQRRCISSKEQERHAKAVYDVTTSVRLCIGGMILSFFTAAGLFIYMEAFGFHTIIKEADEAKKRGDDFHALAEYRRALKLSGGRTEAYEALADHLRTFW